MKKVRSQGLNQGLGVLKRVEGVQAGIPLQTMINHM